MTQIQVPDPEVAVPEVPAPEVAVPAPRRPGRSLPVLAVAGPVGLAVSILLHPLDSADAGASLARIAGDDRARWMLVHLLEPAAWLVLGAVLFRLWSRAAGRGRRLVRAGSVLAGMGASALALVVYAHGEGYLAMTTPGMDRPAMATLYTYWQDAIPLAAPFIPAYQVGLLLLAVGLLRSRAVPRWAGIALLLAPFAQVVVGGADPGATVIAVFGAGPLVAGMAGVARLLRNPLTLQARP